MSSFSKSEALLIDLVRALLQDPGTVTITAKDGDLTLRFNQLAESDFYTITSGGKLEDRRPPVEVFDINAVARGFATIPTEDPLAKDSKEAADAPPNFLADLEKMKSGKVDEIVHQSFYSEEPFVLIDPSSVKSVKEGVKKLQEDYMVKGEAKAAVLDSDLKTEEDAVKRGEDKLKYLKEQREKLGEIEFDREYLEQPLADEPMGPEDTIHKPDEVKKIFESVYGEEKVASWLEDPVGDISDLASSKTFDKIFHYMDRCWDPTEHKCGFKQMCMEGGCTNEATEIKFCNEHGYDPHPDEVRRESVQRIMKAYGVTREELEEAYGEAFVKSKLDDPKVKLIKYVKVAFDKEEALAFAKKYLADRKREGTDETNPDDPYWTWKIATECVLEDIIPFLYGDALD